MKKQEMLIVVRGGGDIATGTIYQLWKSGFRVLVLETEYPSAIRRQVSLCEAVYHGRAQVEDAVAVKLLGTTPKEWMKEMEECYQKGLIPLLVDPKGESIAKLKPQVVVDAILAKKNLGTERKMAPLTIALGPGFEAGVDVDYVIETMRGHNLGRVIDKGFALPDTGVPGVIAGFDKERVIHAEGAGTMKLVHQIGDFVEKDEIIALLVPEKEESQPIPVKASITGLIRGLITEGYPVTKGFKIADIDPRQKEYHNCFTISDKARCIGGSVLGLVCSQVE